MNLSKLTMDQVFNEPEIDNTKLLRGRETKLLEEIDALEHISQSSYWKLIEERIFKPELSLLERNLQEENDTQELFRLQGRVKEAKKYIDFSKLISIRRNELQGIKLQINGKNS